MRYWAPYILLVAFSVNGFSQKAEDEFITKAPKKTPAKKHLRDANNQAFKPGEKLVYRVHYGIIDAGEAVLTVKQGPPVRDRTTFHIVGTGRTLGAFNWFFKVRDRYETLIDEKAITPYFLEFALKS